MKILDVSQYQPVIDYKEVAKHVDGVILRCGVTHWGTANECVADTCFEKHYAGFTAAGVPVGVYYYSAADSLMKVLEEASFCVGLLKGKRFELPVYYDIENPQRMEKLTVQQLTSHVEAWCDVLEQNGYFVGVYANTDYFTRKLDHAKLSEKYTIWLADYRASYNKTLKRDMHQYTSTELVPGISGGVDMSNCYRDFVSVIIEAGLNGTSKKEPDAPETPESEAVQKPNTLRTITVGPMSDGDYDVFYASICQLAHSIGNIGIEVEEV